MVTPTGVARDWVRRNAWRRIGELWTQKDPQQRALKLLSRPHPSTRPHGRPPGRRPSATWWPNPRRPSSRSTRPSASPASVPAPGRGAGASDGPAGALHLRHLRAGPGQRVRLAVARRVASWAEGGSLQPGADPQPLRLRQDPPAQRHRLGGRRARPDKKVVYTTAERFLSTFVRAVMDRTGAAFKDDLRGADLLLIDDVHFISGKKALAGRVVPHPGRADGRRPPGGVLRPTSRPRP